MAAEVESGKTEGVIAANDWDGLPTVKITDGDTLPFRLPLNGVVQRTAIKTDKSGRDFAEFQLLLEAQNEQNERVILICSKTLADQIQKVSLLNKRPCNVWILRVGSGPRDTRYTVATKEPTFKQ